MNKTITILIIFALTAFFVTSTFSEEWVFVDLKPYANSKITDTQWWTGQPGATDLDEILELAQNGHEFEGPGGDTVPFKVEDANLCIYGTNAAQNPEKIEGIKIEAKVQTIYFLHMTGWEAVGVPSYKFVMNYDDGSNEELLMESNFNSDNWDQVPAKLGDENSAWVWEEPAQIVAKGGLIATKWENPHPDNRIETIDFVSLKTAAVPGLFAITLGGASAAIDISGNSAVRWANLKCQ